MKVLFVPAAAFLLAFGGPAFAQDACDDEPAGLHGLCNAYCEAKDCDDEDLSAPSRSCERLLANYRKNSGGLDPPCIREVCDGVDNNGDGQIDEGFDRDGDGVIRCCTSEYLFVTLDTTFHALLAYVSNGDGTFKPPTTIAELATEEVRFVAVDDFDDDGEFDVLWRGVDSDDRFLTVCDGEWQTLARGQWTYVYNGGADLDGDGCTDVVGWDLSNGPVSGPVSGPGVPALGLTALGDCTGSFNELYGTFDPSVSLGQWQIRRTYNLEDVDSDGDLDLVFHHYASGGASPTRLYLALGAGPTFLPPTFITSIPGQPQNGGDLGDIDGDGCIDWIGGGDDDGDRGAIYAMLGDCAGGFSAPFEIADTCSDVPLCPGTGNSPGSGVSLLYDWDHDGDLDLLTSRNVVSGTSATILYWENDPAGSHGPFPGPFVFPPAVVVPPSDLRSSVFATPLRN